MSIKKMTATISTIVDLSKTAKEITLTLPEELNFVAGQFVNIFMDIDGTKVRRAFSISSSDSTQDLVTLSIRESLNGVMSPLFWQSDLTGATIELMGPLGVNTANLMNHEHAYLFAYGVGAGVVKSVLDHVVTRGVAKKIVVMTGSRTEDEILHKEYFDTMAMSHGHIEVRHIVTKCIQGHEFREGFIQDYIDDIDFNNADVYACGQKVACDALVSKINERNPHDCSFFIEAFN